MNITDNMEGILQREGELPKDVHDLCVTMYLTGASTALACMASRVADAGTDTDAAHTAIADELETQLAQLAAARKKYGV